MVLTLLQKSIKQYETGYTKQSETKKEEAKQILRKLPKVKQGLKKAKFIKRYQHSLSYISKNKGQQKKKALDQIKDEVQKKEDYFEFNSNLLSNPGLSYDKELSELKREILGRDTIKNKVKILKKKEKKRDD
ncbi:hypothetical protein K502DRAFT_339755, partial [Neoconidiobolus thromboides FSU 785]